MAILFSNSVGPIPVSVVASEKHDSTIEITEIPIETGASVTDHSYRNPNKVTLEILSEGATVTYSALKRLQESRVPFTLVTGLYVYKNMLIKAITPERTSEFSNVFNGVVDLQEAILVGTTYVANQGSKNAGKPGGAKSTKAATPTKQITSGADAQKRASQTVARGSNNTTPITATSPVVTAAPRGSQMPLYFE